MKKHKKLLISTICVIVFLGGVLFFNYIQGDFSTSEPIEVITQNKKAHVVESMHEINPVVYKTVLVINGEKNPLLCSFENNEKAMESAKKRNAEILKLAEKKWALKELDSSNWKDYQSNFRQYTAGGLPEDLGGDKYYSQYLELQGFLGIYEDSELNKESLKYVNYVNTMLKTKIIRRVSVEPLVHNMPFNNPLVIKWSDACRN